MERRLYNTQNSPSAGICYRYLQLLLAERYFEVNVFHAKTSQVVDCVVSFAMGPSCNGVFLFVFAFFELFIGVIKMDMQQDFPVFKWFLRDRRESETNSTVIGLYQRPLREQNYSFIGSPGAMCNGTLENGNADLFKCPKQGQTSDIVTTEKTTSSAKPEPEVDILTAVSISVSCAVAVTVCLTLYCCCCQRKQRESHPSRVKTMWIRRSVGKQLDRNIDMVGTHHTLLVSSNGNSSTEDQGRNEKVKGDQNEDTLNLVKITITNPSNEHINADQ
ncbi:hypothetical protein CHS0354_037471 [Potamilus streckersoni]|uniref:Uncharacterized protein n=1 Tax=Potamilus streckersoni TaxID=2493646 RepID=A0AAE0RPA8_9BIVA|nr:hypothetical protein CHS0354_037471 [Potamilus streckersoni]